MVHQQFHKIDNLQETVSQHDLTVDKFGLYTFFQLTAFLMTQALISSERWADCMVSFIPKVSPIPEVETRFRSQYLSLL